MNNRIGQEYNWQGLPFPVFFDRASPYATILPLAPTVLYDDFLGLTIDSTCDWNTDVEGTSNAVEINAALNGVLRINTGTAADKRNSVASMLTWAGSKNVVFETRLKTTTSDAGLMLFAGLTDAVDEGSATLPFVDDSLATGTIDSVADDAAMFGVRAETSDDIYALAVKANGTPVSADTGTDLVLATWMNLRIQIDTSGNCRFFIDGALVAEHLAAITAADPLCGFIGGMLTTGSTAALIDIDYIRMWQDR